MQLIVLKCCNKSIWIIYFTIATSTVDQKMAAVSMALEMVKLTQHDCMVVGRGVWAGGGLLS